MQPIEYDRNGRMEYHPDFHPNHKKPMTLEEKAYICYFYERDGRVGLGLALGRTEHTIATQIAKFKRRGLFDHYKNLWTYIERKGGWEPSENLDHLLEKGDDLTYKDIELLYYNGYQHKQIAEALNVKPTTLSKWVKLWRDSVAN